MNDKNTQADLNNAGDPGIENLEEQKLDANGSDNAGTADGSQAGVNTEEADRIAQQRAERASKAAVKSYFKQQGLSEEEAQQAFEVYKAQKAQQEEADRNNLTALQQKLDGYEIGDSEALKKANFRLIRAEAKIQAVNLNVRSDLVDYLIRLSDLSQVEVDEQGNPDKAAIQEALQVVIRDFPELQTKNENDENRP